MALRRHRTIGMTAHGPEVTRLSQRLMELAPKMPQGLGAPIRKQRRDFARLDLSELMHGWEQLEEARGRDYAARESTRVNVPPDDADFAKVNQMEDELDWYMLQAVRLRHLCEAYHSEAEKWRRKAEDLERETKSLVAKTFNIRRDNELTEAAMERLDPSADLGAVLFFRHRGAAGEGGRVASAAPRSTSSSRATSRQLQRATPQGEASRPASEGRGAVAQSLPRAPFSARASGSAARAPGEPGWAAQPPHSARASISSASSAGPREQEFLDEIARLEARLRDAKQKARHGRAKQKADARLESGHKDDMEHFFLLCMHDLQREVARKKSVAAAMKSCPRGRRGERCAKKQPTQRDQVLELLTGSDNLLNLLYEKLFPHRMGASRANAWDLTASMGFEASCSSCTAVTQANSLVEVTDTAVEEFRPQRRQE